MNAEKKQGIGAKAARGARESSEGLAYLIAGAMPWLVDTYLGTDIPDSVVNLATAFIVGMAVRARTVIDRAIF